MFCFVLFQSSSTPGNNDCTELCTTALQHATCLLPFGSYLHADRQLQAVVLSLIPELPQTTETASILAEFFPDAESLEPEIWDKFHRILKEWQGVLSRDGSEDTDVTSNSTPHEQTLDVTYYEKIRERERQCHKKRQAFGAYHDKLFIADDVEREDLLIGSRPFESCDDFLICLDTFYSVGFGSCLEPEATSISLPLIDVFADKVRQEQLERLPARLTKKSQFTRSISVRPSPQAKSAVMRELDVVENTFCRLSEPPPSKCSFDCSRSMNDADFAVQQLQDILPHISSQPIEVDISSQPIEVDALSSKNGLDMTNSAKLHGTSAAKQNTDDGNYVAPSGSPNSFVKARHTSGLSSIEFTSVGDRIKHSFVDHLSESVLPPATVERLKFDGEIAETERLAEWLSGWTVRQSINQARASAIRVRVSPQLLVYSLWLIDSCHNFTPRVNDVTVAVIHGQTPASAPRELSYSSVLVSNVEDENMSLRRGRQSSGTGSSSTGQGKPANDVKKREKGRKEQKAIRRDELNDEVVSGVDQRTWSWDIQTSSLQELTEAVNKSTNNNSDRYDLVFSEPQFPPSSLSMSCLVSLLSQLFDFSCIGAENTQLF